MARESVLFRFNVGTPPGPFNARAEFVEILTGGQWGWSSGDFIVTQTFPFRLNFRYPQDYTIKFFLDDQLAYSGRYQEEQLPF